MSEDKLKQYRKRVEALRKERTLYFDYWGELAENVLFTRGRFLAKGEDKKPKRNTKQFNNTPRRSARTLASGMMAGITSPARPWFKLAASIPGMNDRAAVKEWLHDVQQIMYRVLAQSNIYNQLHSLYAELGVFATGAMGLYQDPKTLVRAKTYTIGGYMLGAGANDIIDTFAREYTKTVNQVVEEFGLGNVSNWVRDKYNRSDYEIHVPITHIVQPNKGYKEGSPFSRNMMFESCYFEDGNSSGKQKGTDFLRKAGFNEFPILCPRWDVRDEQVYSDSCPAMDALGDCKGLQLGEKRYYQALDKVGNPALQGSANASSKLGGGPPHPGEFIGIEKGEETISTIYGNYAPRIDYIAENQREVENRIKETFYVDLFLMLANTDRRQITAREVAEKHEEKLLMLGPVLERLHNELLNPLINRLFNILQEGGYLPPPPPDLVNTEVSVEYVSVLAQAQQLVGLTSIERTVGFVAEITEIWPEARHKIDPMQTVDRYAQDSGVSPDVVRPDDEAIELAAAEAQARAQQAQMERSNTAMDTANKAAQAQQTSAGAADDMREAGLM
jgi:hypothetical protein